MPDRLSQLLALLDTMPDDAECLYGVAFEYDKAGDTEQALAYFDRAIAADPDFTYAYYHKGRVLDEADRAGEAIDVFNAGLARARATGDVKAAGEMEAYLEQLT